MRTTILATFSIGLIAATSPALAIEQARIDAGHVAVEWKDDDPAGLFASADPEAEPGLRALRFREDAFNREIAGLGARSLGTTHHCGRYPCKRDGSGGAFPLSH